MAPTEKRTVIPTYKAKKEKKREVSPTEDEVKIEWAILFTLRYPDTFNEALFCSWKDKDLTWELIRIITEDEITKQGLFPSPGANPSTVKGGGLSKAHHHKEIATRLFADHPTYGPAFRQAKSAREKTTWANKIKNRIQR
jgi:hypothetical protein